MSTPTIRRRVNPESTLDRVRAICLALPGVAEVVKHSRPCFAVGSKTFVMYMDDHHGDGRLALWCKATHDAQQMLVESDAERYFVPPYVGPSGWVGARLDRRPEWGAIHAIIEEAHRLSAPKRLLRAAAAPAEKSATKKAAAKKATAKKAAKKRS